MTLKRRAYRRTGVRLWLTACSSAFLLIAISTLFAAGPDGKDDPTVLQQVIVAPFVLLLAWLTIGVFRQGIWTEPDHVRVRNIFRTYRTTWSAISRIEPPPAYRALRNTGIRFILSDGSTINAALFAAGPGNRPTHADKVLHDLRLDWDRYHKGPIVEERLEFRPWNRLEPTTQLPDTQSRARRGRTMSPRHWLWYWRILLFAGVPACFIAGVLLGEFRLVFLAIITGLIGIAMLGFWGRLAQSSPDGGGT